MRLPSPLAAIVTAAALGLAEAQFLVNELSFGHSGRIETSSGMIPNFQISGTPNPQLLSNKVVLTPPGFRNSRASVWGTAPLQHRSWTADVDFRATGPERAGGNLNVWLVRGGPDAVGTASIYSVGRFDGLALVVNSQGGAAGMVRGFLNDGTTDYSARGSVDELAFGHCQYAYRNLGRPSQLKLRQGPDGFRVEVDGRLCFQTDKFSIPTGYKFGITAATPENPDSFEVFKMVIMSDSAHPDSDDGGAGIRMNNNNNKDPAQQVVGSGSYGSDGAMADQDPELFATSKAQFADLHNRLQGINRQLATVLRQAGMAGPVGESRHAETSKLIHDLTDEVRRLAGIEAELGMRVSAMEKEVRALKGAIHSRVAQSEHVLKGYLVDQHATLSETVLDHARGKHLRLVAIVVGSQVAVVGLYVLYKRRKGMLPKKFL